MAKIAILGLGPSIGLFNQADFELSIGVNDIWRVIKSDVVVCLNYQKVFNQDRLKYIDESKPKAFYSQIVNWDARPDFKKIDISPGYPADRYVNLDVPGYYKSYCSPFVAVQIAYKVYGATEIHLFGVDMTNHPHLDHALCDKIKMHFRHLKIALLDKNCLLIVHGDGILKDI
jgi:hypothetical protein